MTIEDYISQRNEIQIVAENRNKATADRCWIELGVANRHIARVLNGEMRFEVVEFEIRRCLDRAKRMFNIQVEETDA